MEKTEQWVVSRLNRRAGTKDYVVTVLCCFGVRLLGTRSGIVSERLQLQHQFPK